MIAAQVGYQADIEANVVQDHELEVATPAQENVPMEATSTETTVSSAPEVQCYPNRTPTTCCGSSSLPRRGP